MAYDRGELQQVLHPHNGTPSGEGDKRVRIGLVRQRPINGPHPAILAPEVQPVLAPAPTGMNDPVYLSFTWMKWMDYPELPLVFLDVRCS